MNLTFVVWNKFFFHNKFNQNVRGEGINQIRSVFPRLSNQIIFSRLFNRWTPITTAPEIGKTTALVLRNQFLNKINPTSVEVDFAGVELMTPSWLDEFIQEILKTVAKEHIQYRLQNSSVRASLETALET